MRINGVTHGKLKTPLKVNSNLDNTVIYVYIKKYFF